VLLVLWLLIALIALFALAWALIAFAEGIIRPPEQTAVPKHGSIEERRP
jgi:hypothetical protein